MKPITITGPKGTATITAYRGPLGLAYDVRAGGKHLVQCGGGARGEALRRAREYANITVGNRPPTT